MDKDDIIGVEKNEERADDFDKMIYSDSCFVREPEVAYGRRSRKQGEYTVEDYFALSVLEGEQYGRTWVRNESGFARKTLEGQRSLNNITLFCEKTG